MRHIAIPRYNLRRLRTDQSQGCQVWHKTPFGYNQQAPKEQEGNGGDQHDRPIMNRRPTHMTGADAAYTENLKDETSEEIAQMGKEIVDETRQHKLKRGGCVAWLRTANAGPTNHHTLHSPRNPKWVLIFSCRAELLTKHEGRNWLARTLLVVVRDD